MSDWSKDLEEKINKNRTEKDRVYPWNGFYWRSSLKRDESVRG